LPLAYRARDTAHAQWLQTHCQRYPMGDVGTHNSRMDSRKAVGSSNMMEGLTTWLAMYDNLRRSKGQRSRLQGHHHGNRFTPAFSPDVI